MNGDKRVKFSIENKEFIMAENFDKLDDFIIKSTPRDYKVTIKNNSNPILMNLNYWL